MRIKIVFLLLLSWAVISVPAYAGLSATLDSYQTSLDRPVRLTLVSDQQKAMDKLDLSPLEQDFKIIGQSSSSQISMRNGTVSTEAQLFLDLLPRREGELTVPALSAGGEQTTPLVLKVSAVSAGTSPPQRDGQTPGLLVETLWENPGKAYVQSQLNLIIRIYHQGNLLEAALDEPRPLDTLVKRIGDDLQGASSKGGIQYQTIERHYALFPQKSGTLTIPPIAMQARVPASSRQNNQRFGYDPFSRGSQITLSSKPLLKEILPPADSFTGHTWLPSDRVTLSRSGLPEAPIKRGDAINMQIDLSALGLSGTQLPEVQIPVSNTRFRLYPDQPSYADKSPDGQIIEGRRRQTFVLIASEAGALEIPKIEVAWWDRQNDRQQTASLPAVTIEVAAAESSAETPTNEAPVANPRPSQSATGSTASSIGIESSNEVSSAWKWLSLASLSGWLLSIGYFVYYHHRRNGKPSPPPINHQATKLRPLVKLIKTAASGNRANDTREALQAYARVRWPDRPPPTPEDWARRLENPEAGQVIAALETDLFDKQQNSDWKGEDFCKVLLPVLSKIRTENKNTRSQAVPGLYPAE